MKKIVILITFLKVIFLQTQAQSVDKAYIISIEDGKVFLDAKMGQVIVGDIFKLVKEGGYMEHPVTKEKIKKKDILVCEITIDEVMADYSTGTANPQTSLQDITVGQLVYNTAYIAPAVQPVQSVLLPDTSPKPTTSANVNTGTPVVAPPVVIVPPSIGGGVTNTTVRATTEAKEFKTRYDRSSLTMMLIRRTDKVYDYQKEIEKGYQELEIPDKYDSIPANNIFIEVTGKEDRSEIVGQSLTNKGVARDLIAKWFNRKPDGTFDMATVTDRAFWNATERDVKLAGMQQRGLSVIADYGENLIGNTFVVVNEITYFDKEKAGKTASAGFQILGAAASIAALAGGPDIRSYTDKVQTVAAVGAITSEILAKGFSVTITSYLFKLNWNKEIANNFYTNYYIDKPNPYKQAKFDLSSDFSLSYIGKFKERASIQSTIFSASTQDELIVKTLNEALDKSIYGLQQNYEVFRVKIPLATGDPLITAKVGLKDGINSKSRFDVLEQIEKDGVREFRKVGAVKPISSQIWDNRYMAHLGKGSAKGNTSINATYFKKQRGAELMPGMLLRERKTGLFASNDMPVSGNSSSSSSSNTSNTSSTSNATTSNTNIDDYSDAPDPNRSKWYLRLDAAYTQAFAKQTVNDYYDNGGYVYDSYTQQMVWQQSFTNVQRMETAEIVDCKLNLEVGYKFKRFSLGFYSETYVDMANDIDNIFMGMATRYDWLKKNFTPFTGLRACATIDAVYQLQWEAGLKYKYFILFYNGSYMARNGSDAYIKINNLGLGLIF